jgi:hypothetical protein
MLRKIPDKHISITEIKNNFDRLVHVKTKVDPANFFRNEQSIPPLSSWISEILYILLLNKLKIKDNKRYGGLLHVRLDMDRISLCIQYLPS